MKRITIYFLVILIMVFPLFVLAQGMSELNIKDFEKKTTAVTDSDVVKSPFMPAKPVARDLAIEDLFLNGVAIGPTNSYALINGIALTIGDSIAGLRVKSIDKKKVVLQQLDKFHTLYIEGGM